MPWKDFRKDVVEVMRALGGENDKCKGTESGSICYRVQGLKEKLEEKGVGKGVPRPCKELGLYPERSGESPKGFRPDTQLDNYYSDCIIGKG